MPLTSPALTLHALSLPFPDPAGTLHAALEVYRQQQQRLELLGPDHSQASWGGGRAQAWAGPGRTPARQMWVAPHWVLSAYPFVALTLKP